jgi:23S rRNA pseudouridine2605 synthase
MKNKPSGHFGKFAKKKSNAAIKEQFKQEKRKVKKEREEFFDKKRAEKYQGARDKAQDSRYRGQGTGYKGQDARHKEQGTGYKGQDARYKEQGTGYKGQDARSREQGTRDKDQYSGRPKGDQPQPGRDDKDEGSMPLNKFIAHAGICGRREAAEMVKAGKVKVNNELVTEPGHKVSQRDEIRVNGKKIFRAKNLVYILLNKPKDYITTTDDPQKRKTVLDLISRATPERVYPVGRLDRNTSGVLLLTNDGELAQKLTHPSHEVKKIYAVTLNKPLEKKDFDQILKGVVLEDGPASVDVLAYADIKDKTLIGVEIHSGRNRIVRRIFESLGYDVKNLDRVTFAGLTKKNVERGKWRYLSEKEVRDLKHFGKGKR